MTNVAFTIELYDMPLEGWCDVDITFDMDNEPQWVDVLAIELFASVERDRQIMSGAAIQDNVPLGKLGDEIAAKVIDWCNNDGWEWCLDAAERTGSIPQSHPNDWLHIL